MSNPPATLSPALTEVLNRVADKGYAERLRQVYVAATHASMRLADIDLLQYESTSIEDAPDLSMWEEMAPVIRDTVMDVNALLMVMRQHFPVHPAGGLGDALSKAIEGATRTASPMGSGPARRAAQAEEVLHATSIELAQEVTHLGERMRSPSVVSDRWNLLSDLQSFRTTFREKIGNMVYATAAAFAEVHKKDAIPYYADQVGAAVALRATVADLERVVAARLSRVREAEPEDVLWNAQQLQKELDTFGKTPAYRALRAQDKRVVLELRAEVRPLAMQKTLQKVDLLSKVEAFAAFVSSLAEVNRRELLIEHDRELTAECGVALERANQLFDQDPAGAGQALGEAIAAAQGLYGRLPQLDLFLRKLRKQPLSVDDLPAVRQAADTLLALLGEIAAA